MIVDDGAEGLERAVASDIDLVLVTVDDRKVAGGGRSLADPVDVDDRDGRVRAEPIRPAGYVPIEDDVPDYHDRWHAHAGTSSKCTEAAGRCTSTAAHSAWTATR